MELGELDGVWTKARVNEQSVFICMLLKQRSMKSFTSDSCLFLCCFILRRCSCSGKRVEWGQQSQIMLHSHSNCTWTKHFSSSSTTMYLHVGILKVFCTRWTNNKGFISSRVFICIRKYWKHFNDSWQCCCTLSVSAVKLVHFWYINPDCTYKCTWSSIKPIWFISKPVDRRIKFWYMTWSIDLIDTYTFH
jgi:hypothetical protein